MMNNSRIFKVSVIFAVLFSLGAIFMGFVYMKSISSYDAEIDEQLSEISDLKVKLDKANLSYEETKATMSEDVGGLNVAKTVADDEIAKAFFAKVMTWDSYQEYADIREDLMKNYGLAEDSSFLTKFMPEVRQVQSSGGNLYNRIDQDGLNSSFTDMKSRALEVTPNGYKYFTVVDFTVTGRELAGAAGASIQSVVFTYMINSSGEIENIEAWPITK